MRLMDSNNFPTEIRTNPMNYRITGGVTYSLKSEQHRVNMICIIQYWLLVTKDTLITAWKVISRYRVSISPIANFATYS